MRKIIKLKTDLGISKFGNSLNNNKEKNRLYLDLKPVINGNSFQQNNF